MSTSIVFTGAAELSDGTKILRAQLTKAAEQHGYRVVNRVMPGVSFLVASRDDTVKARSAKEKGLQVYTYENFVAHLRMLGTEPTLFGGELNAYVDCAPSNKAEVL